MRDSSSANARGDRTRRRSISWRALDAAIGAFSSIVDASGPELRERGFDFSIDYNLLNELGTTLFDRAKLERGPQRKAARDEYLRRAVATFEKVLSIDPENVTAHYNLGLLYTQLGDKAKGREHMALHQKYKPDDNARDRAVAIARERDAAADHASEANVIYDLRRPGAFELGAPASVPMPAERYVVREGGTMLAGPPVPAPPPRPASLAVPAPVPGGRP
jgi:tetratricopeptide (TPR) repeat protein